jgi:hypothetical protein
MGKPIILRSKEVLPFRNGLKDGATGHALSFDHTNDTYSRQFESKAYKAGYRLANNDIYVSVWRTGRPLCMIKYAIKMNHIKPMGWQVSRLMESGFRPFIDEINKGK